MMMDPHSQSDKKIFAINPDLQKQVSPILTNMVSMLLKKKPQDPVPHIVQFLEEMQGVATPGLSADELVELEMLRVKHQKLKAIKNKASGEQSTAGAQPAASMAAAKKKKAKASASSEDGSSSDSEGEEDVGELPIVQPMAAGTVNKRISVSAEVFGKYNKKEEYVPHVVFKTHEVKERIQERLQMAFMFKALGAEELNIVIDAMEEKKFDQGQTVITEGEAGSVLFVVDEGQLDCSKRLEGNFSEPTYLKTYQPGEAFGELALLYNAPRAATIVAKTAVTLWQLDRNTFNHIVKDAAQTKRDRYEDFLSSVPILQSIDHYERSKMADAIKEQTFAAGTQIITQGDEGNDFFIIISGQAVATKVLEAGSAPTQVKEYGTSDYFGERALLKSEPRAANVIAQSELKVATIDRDSFMRLLGPLDTILQRNMDQYIAHAAQ